MKTGLLWFDDAPSRTLEDKVLRAAARYEQKYGRLPNLCFVHPKAFDGNGKVKKVGEVEIRAGRSVLPDHFWIGVEDGNGSNGKAASGAKSLVARVEAEAQPMTPERARQLAMELTSTLEAQQ